MNGKNFWLVFITGVTAGAVAALLYAPQSGEETRKKLGKAYDDTEGHLKDSSDYLKDQAERLSKEANSAYKKGVKQLDEAYEKASESLSTAYSDAKEKLAGVTDSTLDKVDAASKKARSLV